MLNKPLKKRPKTFQVLPKWRIFAKSGHTIWDSTADDDQSKYFGLEKKASKVYHSEISWIVDMSCANFGSAT